MLIKYFKLRIININNSYSEYKLGIKCLFFSYIPLFFFFILFQIFIQNKNVESTLYVNSLNYTPFYLILYIGFGAAHITLSVSVIAHFIKLIWPKTKELKRQILVTICTIIPINTLPVILTTWLFDPSLAWYSHERIYMIIKKTTIFKHFFNDASLFHSFSIFPVTLIISGLLVQVFAALNLGRVIHLFRQKQRLFKDKEKFKIDAQNHLKSIREIVRITSLIMVTSTICTFLLFLIPIPFLSDLKFQDSYYQTSISLGVYWGIIFSLTLLFLGLWSFYSWSQIVNSVLRDKKFQADQDISKWLIEKSDLFSLVSNAHFSLSIAFPLIMSILSAIASKMF